MSALLFVAASAAQSVGVTARDIAWPIVLVLCGALMILPFAFLVLVFRAGDAEPTANQTADQSADVSAVVSRPAAGRGR